MNSALPNLASDLSLFLELAAASLYPTTLSAARLIPIVWLAPTFGGRLLPLPARITLALGLSLVLAPPWTSEAVPLGLSFALALTIEMLIGTALGLLASLPFELARASGHLIDVSRGAAMAQVIAPGLCDRATPTGDILYLAILVALTAAGGDRLLILALADGFVHLPPGAALTLEGSGAIGKELIEATSALLATALLLAAPPLIAALLADLLLGVVGRVVPQLPLFFLGMPVKTVLGLLVVAFALGPILSAVFESGAEMLETILDLLCFLGGKGQ